ERDAGTHGMACRMSINRRRNLELVVSLNRLRGIHDRRTSAHIDRHSHSLHDFVAACPCFTADCAWNAMQGSHLVATEIARAINSLVLISSAFGSKAARARAENSFITFGDPERSSLTAADISVVIPSQFLFMVSLFSCGA